MANDTWSHAARTLLERQARLVIAARLCAERRVLILDGDASWGSFLENAEASEVLRIDAPGEELPHDDNRFELVIAFELHRRLAIQPELASEIRRILTPGGILVTSAPSAEGRGLDGLAGLESESGLSADELETVFADTFAESTTFGQIPLVGSLFYDYDAEELEADLDRRFLADDPEPGAYVLVFGPETFHSEFMTVAELPFEQVQGALGAIISEPERIRAELQATVEAHLREEIGAELRRKARAALPDPRLSDRSRLNDELARALAEAE
ncbi:MAG: methyltransferase domain-containing protein, partial [Myxococcota bacterium]